MIYYRVCWLTKKSACVSACQQDRDQKVWLNILWLYTVLYLFLSVLCQDCSAPLCVWFLCRQFGGYAKETDYVSYAAKLKSALGSEAAYHKDFYFCNGYDPPMKPYGRRNEVWFVKE